MMARTEVKGESAMTARTSLGRPAPAALSSVLAPMEAAA